MCEPLFQLADFIGGEWPARIRIALGAIFDQELKYNLQPNLQLLAALRDWIARSGADADGAPPP